MSRITPQGTTASVSNNIDSPKRLRGILCMVFAAIGFGTMSAFIKVASQTLPPFQIVFFRGFFGWVVPYGLELIWNKKVVRGVDSKRLLLRSLFGFIGIAMYVWAISKIDLGIASALNQSSPVFVALFSLILLREKPPIIVPLLVLLAFFGAQLIVAPDLSNIDWNAVIGLISAVSSGLAYIFVRKLGKTDGPWVIIRWFSGWSVVLSIPFLVFWGTKWPNLKEFSALFGVGVFGLLGQAGMTYAYKYERASIVSPFMYISVLTSMGFGFAFWQELPGVLALVGCCLIVGASLLIGWISTREQHHE